MDGTRLNRSEDGNIRRRLIIDVCTCDSVGDIVLLGRNLACLALPSPDDGELYFR